MSALCRWVRAERGGDGGSVGQNTVLDMANQSVLAHSAKENERLNMEREILKGQRQCLLCLGQAFERRAARIFEDSRQACGSRRKADELE